MNNVRTKILKKLLEQDLIQDSKENGIARSAAENGYESLSGGPYGQKSVLEKYFSPICEGDDIHQDCHDKLSDEEHLHALDQIFIYEKISCSNCCHQMDHQKHTWEKIRNE